MSRTPPELPVERLSDETWARIEADVFERLAREADASEGSPPSTARPPRWRWPAAGLAAAALVGLVLVTNRGPEAPHALDVQRITTGGSPADAQIGDVDVGVAARTRLTAVGDVEQGWVVVLESGTARFVVPPRGVRPPFTVHAGTTRVEVVGTIFEVSRDAADGVTVRVEEGTVRVTDPAGTRLVREGSAFPRPEEVAGAGAGAPPTAPRGGLTAPAPDAAKAPVVEEANPAETTKGPTARSVGPKPPERSGEGPPPVPASDEVRFNRAAALERSDPDAAIGIYLSVAGGGSAWAEIALFAAGRLADEQDRRDQAQRLLERYLRRYPDGSLAQDAREILGR